MLSPSFSRRLCLCLLLLATLSLLSSPVIAQQQDGIEVVDVQKPEEVVVGEPVPIELTIANNQPRATNVTVQAAGATTDTVTVELRPNSDRSITLSPEAPSKQIDFEAEITLWERDGGSLPYVAERVSLAADTLRDGASLTLRPLTPEQSVTAGEPVVVGFEAINQGSQPVDGSFEISANGETTRSFDLSLPAGASRIETVELNAPTTGSTTVTIRQTSGPAAATATVRTTDTPVTASIAKYDAQSDQLIIKAVNHRNSTAQAFLTLNRNPGPGSATTEVAQEAVDLSPDGDHRINVSVDTFDIESGTWTLSMDQIYLDGDVAQGPEQPTHVVDDELLQHDTVLAPSKEIEQSPTNNDGGATSVPITMVLGGVVLVGFGVSGGYFIGSRIIS